MENKTAGAGEGAPKDEPLVVRETADGSAEILIDGEAETRGLREEGTGTSSVQTRTSTDDDDHHTPDAAEAAELAAAQSEEEREQIRQRRRDERKQRKQRQREREQAKDREIAALKRTVGELVERQGTLETRGFASDLARVDEGIRQAQEAADEAKRAMAEATATQNGEALAEAQELWYDARRRVEALSSVKQRLTRAGEAELRNGGAPRGRAAPAREVPAEVRRHGDAWMSRNSWYNPEGTNPDSRIALTVDAMLVERGLDPKTAEYWEELDTELKKYLPHRYSGVQSGSGAGNGPAAGREGNGVQMRTEVTTSGSGRSQGPAGSSTRFVLSSERVQAIKDAGAWDDPARRDRMIKRYREYDLQNPSKGN